MPIYAFIDSQNLNLGIRDQGWKLDFARFRVYLKDKYKVEKAFLFIGFLEKNKQLYKNLTDSGYILITKPAIEYYEDGKIRIKGNVDAELVLHSMIQYSNYDKAVIITGDGDFHCLLKYLTDKHKLQNLLIPNKHKYSQLLSNFKERTDFVTNLRNKLEKTKREA